MKLIKGVGLFLSTAVLTCSFAFAHVSNENTIYDDTQNSNAKEDLVYLRALGVIPYAHGANIYMPQDLLTKKDLGHWAAQFLHNDANKTEDDYVALALNSKIIDAVDGNATYKDVVVAFFGEGALVDEDIKAAIEGKEDTTVTREEFALFLGDFVERETQDGLFNMTTFEKGPNGVIEEVKTTEITEHDSTYKVYSFVIDGEELAINGHPKALRGDVEFEKWEGKTLEETWLTRDDKGEYEAVFLALKDGELKQETPAKAKEAKKADADEESSFPWVLTGGIVVVVLLLFFIVKSRKR